MSSLEGTLMGELFMNEFFPVIQKIDVSHLDFAGSVCIFATEKITMSVKQQKLLSLPLVKVEGFF